MSTTTADAASIRCAPVPARATSPAWADVRAGTASMLPLVVAYMPFALVIGTAVADHGGLPAGIVGTAVIFGGSAQLATIRSLEGAGVAAAILAGLVVNARLVVYSAGLSRRWRGQPRWFRFVAAAMVIDPTWAVGERLAEECPDPVRQRRRFLAAGTTLGVGFTATVAVGIVAAGRIGVPDLEVAVPLCLLALVGPALGRPADRRVVVGAALVGLLTAGWPSGTGLVAATVAGCLAGGRTAEVQQ
jgi:predicted branched-subunit amino acid permease